MLASWPLERKCLVHPYSPTRPKTPAPCCDHHRPPPHHECTKRCQPCHRCRRRGRRRTGWSWRRQRTRRHTTDQRAGTGGRSKPRGSSLPAGGFAAAGRVGQVSFGNCPCRPSPARPCPAATLSRTGKSRTARAIDRKKRLVILYNLH
jgi:hypothetical protein